MSDDPNTLPGEQGEPVLLPETPVAEPARPETGARPGVLADVLPEITALAQRVGGFRRLAEIAEELERSTPEAARKS